MPTPGHSPSCVTLNLGGVDLNPNMLWEDRFAFQAVAQETQRTLGGRLVTFAQQLFKGRPITLTANQDQGWMILDQVTAIQALAEVVGATYALQVDAEVFQVQFRHQEPPAFQATLLIAHLNPVGGGQFGDQGIDYFTAEIRLEEI